MVKADSLQAAVARVSMGDAHGCASDELGNVYTWGRTREGQCGLLDLRPVEEPRLLTELGTEWVVSVACGADASFAVTATGAVYQWGAVHKPSNQLAHADVAGYGRSVADLDQATQRMLQESMSSFLSGGDEGGHEGNNGNHAAGGMSGGPGVDASTTVGTRRELKAAPERVALPLHERALQVAAGFGFAVVVLHSGAVLAWGMNDRFQLGLGDRVPRDVPTRVAALEGVHVVSAACGQQRTPQLYMARATCHAPERPRDTRSAHQAQPPPLTPDTQGPPWLLSAYRPRCAQTSLPSTPLVEPGPGVWGRLDSLATVER